MMATDISVVVPTYKRPDLLSRCLAELIKQDFDPERFEIIVADDAAEPRIQEFVRNFPCPGRTRVRYIAVEGCHGPAAARNHGWRASRAPIIAFTDDDTLPAAGWLSAGVRAFRLDIDAIWGKLVMPLPPDPTDYELNASGLAGAGFVTANCFCRREALERIGGFDERFTVAWREDSDLYFSLLRHGCRVAHAPQAVVVHPIRPAFWGVSLKQQSKSLFDALLFKKHPDLFRTHIHPRTPWNYYVMAAALVLCGVGAAYQATAVSLAAGAAWLIATARFCRRRLRGTSHELPHVLEMAITSALIPPVAVFWRLVGALKYRAKFL